MGDSADDVVVLGDEDTEGRADSTYLESERPAISTGEIVDDDADYIDTPYGGGFEDTISPNDDIIYEDPMPTTDTDLTEEGSHVLEITLICVGTIGAFIIITVIIVLCCRKRNKRRQDTTVFRKISTSHVTPKVRFQNSIKRIRNWGHSPNRNNDGSIEEIGEAHVNVYGKHEKKKKKGKGPSGGAPTHVLSDHDDYGGNRMKRNDSDSAADNSASAADTVLVCRVVQM